MNKALKKALVEVRNTFTFNINAIHPRDPTMFVGSKLSGLGHMWKHIDGRIRNIITVGALQRE